MKKGQTIWAKKLFDDYKDRLTEGRGYTIISSNSDGIIIIDDNGVEIYNGLIWFECFFSITPPHEVVLIAEQPKEETLFVRLLQSQSHVWHYSKVGQIFEVAPFDKDCYLVVGVNPKEHGFNEPLFISHSDCKVLASSGQPNLLEVKDNQLFTAAVAAMQGMLANESFSNPEEGLPDLSVAWDYAEALINEGKKRGKLD